MISTITVIAVGGALGALARHGVSVSSVHILGHGFPWGTLIVNILGSFLMGLVIAKFATMDNVSQEQKKQGERIARIEGRLNGNIV